MTKTEPQHKTPHWIPYVSILKDIFYIGVIAAQLIYGFGAKMTSNNETQLQDHIAIQDLQKQLIEMRNSQAEMTGEVKFLVQQKFNEKESINGR